MARAARPAGTLAAAVIGQAFPDREEVEMSAFPAADVVDDDVLITADGYEQLCAELEALRTVRRAALTEQLREAREDGDPDNPMLFDLLEEQAQLEGRISALGRAGRRGAGRRAGEPTVRLGSEAACACATATAVTSPSTTWSGRSSPTSATAVCRSRRRSVARCRPCQRRHRRRRDAARAAGARDPRCHSGRCAACEGGGVMEPGAARKTAARRDTELV